MNVCGLAAGGKAVSASMPVVNDSHRPAWGRTQLTSFTPGLPAVRFINLLIGRFVPGLKRLESGDKGLKFIFQYADKRIESGNAFPECSTITRT